jgi:adenine phosphoribosyltransferase
MLDPRFLRDRIRTVPDWPQPGVMFRDITPLLQDPKTLRMLVASFVLRYMDRELDVIAGIDARGFIIGAVVAHELNLGFVPIRKQGKLPFTTVAESYDLEYGSASVELHADACRPGDRVLLIDDLIATGGTMMAGKRLVEKLGGIAVEGAAIVDLPGAGWKSKRLGRRGDPRRTRILPSGCGRSRSRIDCAGDLCSEAALDTPESFRLQRASVRTPSRPARTLATLGRRRRRSCIEVDSNTSVAV